MGKFIKQGPIPKGLKCRDCGKPIKVGDEDVVHWTDTDTWQCKDCSKFQTEVYSRIVGYYRPVKQWNVGKQEEWKDRKTFKPN